jgi:hypothetical protein
MLSEGMVEKLVSKFWEKVSDMSWNDWCSMSSKDKEEIVGEIISELDDITLDIDEVYECFWDWESGLEESSFVDFESFNK